MGNEFEKNHYFPKYNLNYWKEINSKLYDKKLKKDRNFNPANNFQLKQFYYFDGTPNLEKRLGKIENYMSQVLKKISDSTTKSSIELSEYEINFIQLFLFLQASRQLNTTEVIQSDETGIYQSNNFLFGVHNLKTKEAMQAEMYSLVNALESLIKKKSSKDLEIWMGMQVTSTHLVIARNSNNQICQSDTCCIIENDMDSNHMYTYFPQTPNIAFFLVKSKYFYREWHRQRYLQRVNDEIISPILKEQEKGLVCQYVKEGFSERSGGYTFSMAPINSFTKLKQNRIKLTFFELSNDIVNQYNKILFDDGTIFVHSQKEQYISTLSLISTDYRKITFQEIDIDTLRSLFQKQQLVLKDELNDCKDEEELLPSENFRPISSTKPNVNRGILQFDFIDLDHSKVDTNPEHQDGMNDYYDENYVNQVQNSESSSESGLYKKDKDSNSAQNKQSTYLNKEQLEQNQSTKSFYDLPSTSQGTRQEELNSHRQEANSSSDSLSSFKEAKQCWEKETNQVEEVTQTQDTSGMDEYFQ